MMEKGQSIVWNSMGKVYQKQGFYKEALDCLYKSLSLKIDDEYGKALVYYEIGKIYEKEKNLDKAVENLTMSFDMNYKIGNKKGINIVGSKLRKLLILSNQNEKADYVSKKIEEIYSLNKDIYQKEGIITRIIYKKNYFFGFIQDLSEENSIYFSSNILSISQKENIKEGDYVIIDCIKTEKGLSVIHFK